jgi:hypothetical protein
MIEQGSACPRAAFDAAEPYLGMLGAGANSVMGSTFTKYKTPLLSLAAQAAGLNLISEGADVSDGLEPVIPVTPLIPGGGEATQ